MTVLRKLWATLRHEPVAVWGAVLAAVDTELVTIKASSVVLTLVNIVGALVLRSQVSPVDPTPAGGDAGEITFLDLMALTVVVLLLLFAFGVLPR